MNTLILVDDLNAVKSSKNKLILHGLRHYIRHLASNVNHYYRINHDSKDEIYVLAPSEVLEFCDLPPQQKLFYNQWISEIDYQKAGEWASYFTDQWEKLEVVRRECPFLFESDLSVSKMAFVRLAYLYCYFPLIHRLLIERALDKISAKKLVVLSLHSEIDQIALAIAKKRGVQVDVLQPSDLWGNLVSMFCRFLYWRDRKLHAVNTLPVVRAGSRVAASTRKRICLAPAHPLHFRVLLPLAERINQERAYEAFVLIEKSMKSFEKELRERNIAFEFIENYVPAGKAENCFQNYLKKLKKSWYKIEQDQKFQQTFRDDALDWFPILRDKMKSFFVWSFSEVLLLKERFSVAYKALSPAALFVFSDARLFESSAALVAKHLKVPVFFHSPNQIFSREAINRYNTGDYLFLLGPHIEGLVKQKEGVSPERIKVVGDIRVEFMERFKTNVCQQETRKKLGIPIDKKIYLLISTYLMWKFTRSDKQFFFSMVRDAFKELTDSSALVIKSHPNENELLLREFVMAQGMTNFPLALKDGLSMYPLLGAAHAIITIGSMASFEAMMLNIPVITVPLPGRGVDWDIPFVADGGAISVSNATELRQVVARLNTDSIFYGEWGRKGKKFSAQYIKMDSPEPYIEMRDVMNRVLASRTLIQLKDRAHVGI